MTKTKEEALRVLTLFEDRPLYREDVATSYVDRGVLTIDDLPDDLQKRVPTTLKVKQVSSLRGTRRPTAQEQCPAYRSAMRDAGRGHLLP